ncbi:MAG: hypothetical protein ACT4NL_04505 [Pseudomarimonas sp.]
MKTVPTPAWSLLASALLLAATSTRASAGDSCARVSTFDVGARGDNLFAAVLISVDGELPGPTHADSWRIEPGPHTLSVAEAIDSNRFSAINNRARDGSQGNRYKELTLVAEAGMTYRLAARFHPDKANQVRGGGHWEPVIWKTSAEACG